MCMMSVRVQLMNQLVPVRLSAGPRTPRRPCGAAGSELKLNPTPMGTGWGRRNGSSGVVDQAVRADHMGMGVSRVSGHAVRHNNEEAASVRSSIISRVASRRAPVSNLQAALHAAVARVPRPCAAPRTPRVLLSLSAWPWPVASGSGEKEHVLAACLLQEPGCSGRALLCRARDVSEPTKPTARPNGEAPLQSLQECLCFFFL